jgi:hypothetical protein
LIRVVFLFVLFSVYPEKNKQKYYSDQNKRKALKSSKNIVNKGFERETGKKDDLDKDFENF